jgi:CRISPR-associated protein Cmr2
LEQWKEKMRGSLSSMNPNTIPFLKQKAEGKEWLLKIDGDCYFPEAFTSRYLLQNYGMDKAKSEKVIPAALFAQKQLVKAANKQPTPYYAIIQMDGDHMGTAGTPCLCRR